MRFVVLAAAVLAAVIGVFLLDPILQDPAYHLFADERELSHVPNFWNVATNLPFLVAGVLGLFQSARLASPRLAAHYRVFCSGVALVAFGSAWYHLAPSDASLVWDRLPMTIAFMAFFAALIADRIHWMVGRALLWPLVVVGLASIAWWARTESAGAGDLRAYGLVQFLPILVAPLILWFWRDGSLSGRHLGLAFFAYVAAKLAEHFDAAIYAATGFGGHAIKHLFAALAAWWIVRSFQGAPARAL
ncbi:MAG TPA: ceramidase domain-containing protein [Steroidobacteraceae bacterium]|nr:ceramidase domain-containing protein [Steroidobacteraceae bacterium]